MILEICATNLEAALNAARFGADRIELCTAIDTGGLTPSRGLLRSVVQAVAIPVQVLIRPREGHFVYQKAEIDQMIDDILLCRETGAAGVVLGALTPDRHIDLRAMERLLDAAQGMDVTFHRAFDYLSHPFAALDTLFDLKIPRVLSSGQAASAWEGRQLLRELVQSATGRIRIMPGAGISPANLPELISAIGAEEWHMTVKVKTPREAATQLVAGLPDQYWTSDPAQIQAARRILDHL
jgi:copper homeostasis protein